jgi:hypothetical protein
LMRTGPGSLGTNGGFLLARTGPITVDQAGSLPAGHDDVLGMT